MIKKTVHIVALCGLLAAFGTCPDLSAGPPAGNVGAGEPSLLASALAAAGLTDPAQVRQYEMRLDDLARELQPRPAPSTNLERARAIHEFLHARVLQGGYDASLSDLGKTLDEGRFNCLSATVLIAAIGERLGLRVTAQATAEHVLAIVHDGSNRYEIETTSPAWLCRPASAGRELNQAGLIALVYYNRGRELLLQGDFRQAATANAAALALDPLCAAARDNLLATLNNWSVELAGKSDLETARAILDRAQALAPDYQPLRVNRRYIERVQSKLSLQAQSGI